MWEYLKRDVVPGSRGVDMMICPTPLQPRSGSSDAGCARGGLRVVYLPWTIEVRGGSRSQSGTPARSLHVVQGTGGEAAAGRGRVGTAQGVGIVARRPGAPGGPDRGPFPYGETCRRSRRTSGPVRRPRRIRPQLYRERLRLPSSRVDGRGWAYPCWNVRPAGCRCVTTDRPAMKSTGRSGSCLRRLEGSPVRFQVTTSSRRRPARHGGGLLRRCTGRTSARPAWPRGDHRAGREFVAGGGNRAGRGGTDEGRAAATEDRVSNGHDQTG